MKTFKQTQKHIVDFATEKGACSTQLNRAKSAKNIDELLGVVKDNLSWVRNNMLFNGESIKDYFTIEKLIASGVGNLGEKNIGFSNTGDRNTGDSNTGYRNTGAFCTDNS